MPLHKGYRGPSGRGYMSILMQENKSVQHTVAHPLDTISVTWNPNGTGTVTIKREASRLMQMLDVGNGHKPGFPVNLPGLRVSGDEEREFALVLHEGRVYGTVSHRGEGGLPASAQELEEYAKTALELLDSAFDCIGEPGPFGAKSSKTMREHMMLARGDLGKLTGLVRNEGTQQIQLSFMRK